MRLMPALSRSFDLRLPSNRFVLAATPTAGVVAGTVGLLRGETLITSIEWGFGAGGSAFLAWAIARELHPDRQWVASIAALIAPFGLIWHDPDLLAAAAVLLAARAVAGTTGRWMRPVDLGLLVVVAAPVAFRAAGFGTLGASAIGLVLVVIWDERRIVPAAGALLYAVGAVVSAVRHDQGFFDGDPVLLLWIGAGAGLVSLLGPGVVDTGTDRRGGTIVPSRIRVARLVALLAAGAASITFEPAAMAAVWAALAATALRP